MNVFSSVSNMFSRDGHIERAEKGSKVYYIFNQKKKKETEKKRRSFFINIAFFFLFILQQINTYSICMIKFEVKVTKIN